jgi:hypothetical protein
MDSFEDRSHSVIEQSQFVEVADGLLGQAENPDIAVDMTMVAARKLIQALDDIESGALEVQPPLADEQVTNYRKQTSLVISIGEKSMKALEQSSRRGIKGRKAGKGKSEKPSYAGSGSDAKS